MISFIIEWLFGKSKKKNSEYGTFSEAVIFLLDIFLLAILFLFSICALIMTLDRIGAFYAFICIVIILGIAVWNKYR